MGITVMVMTDGRAQYIHPAIESMCNLHGAITGRIIHDDSGDPRYAAWLRRTFPAFTVYSTAGRSGFAGAYRSAWSYLRQHADHFIFSTEDDFVFTRPVDLDALAAIVQTRDLAQMALLRQPWNDDERRAGGIVQQHPQSYVEYSLGDHEWLEHRRFFTTNPHLTTRAFVDAHDWPEGEHSEGRFGVDLFTDPSARCAFWGGGEPWVEHIGVERIGTGY